MRSKWMWLALVFSSVAFADPLIGPGVGNADALVAEGNKLYNAKQHQPASDAFLKATRANPSTAAAYLGYARARFALKDLARACYGYKAWLKAAPDTASDRPKVQSELELCERQKAAQKKAPPDTTAQYVEKKSDFFNALEKKKLAGEGSAHAALKELVGSGYLGADLSDMAQKLNAEAIGHAESLYKRALAKENVPAEELRSARSLYAVAAEVGPASALAEPHSAFAEAMAELHGGNPKKAESLLSEAIKAEPSVAEYKFLRATALLRAGDNQAALKAMESDLPSDPRTHALRAALAVSDSPSAGAAELEKLLFDKRFQSGK
jgi:thioredoxin-like negative regulator of GroEL